MGISLLLTSLISDVFSQQLPPTVGQQSFKTKCDLAKEKCHNDTECFHRLMYIHTTCVTGGRSDIETCKLQCKTGVLRLFDNPYGREVLQSEMDCIATVSQEIRDCNLDPKGSAIHCTLAQSICELDPTCRRLLDQYESRCEGRLSSTNCPSDCAEYLRAVLADKIGLKLANCACWRQDPLCQFAIGLIDPCRDAAAKLNSTTVGQSLSFTTTFGYKTGTTQSGNNNFFSYNNSLTTKLDSALHSRNLGVSANVISGVVEVLLLRFLICLLILIA